MMASDAQIKALFFDANGVLYHRPKRHVFRDQFLRECGLSAPESETLWRATRLIRDDVTLGKAPREALFDVILAVCGVTNPDLRQTGRLALAADEATIALYEGVYPTLRALQARGIRLGVITNSATPTQEKLRWFATCGLDLRWDAFVNSCEVSVRKPNPRIYEIAITQCDVRASETAFVGHDVAELAGASAAGMRTIVFQATPDIHADMTIARFAELMATPF